MLIDNAAPWFHVKHEKYEKSQGIRYSEGEITEEDRMIAAEIKARVMGRRVPRA